MRAQRAAAGLSAPAHPGPANRRAPFETTEAEREARTELTSEHTRVLRAQLPALLKRLEKIPDPRQPGKVKHALASLMLFGLLCFVLQIGSRREATRELSWPQFKHNLRTLFPELDTLPHADTLFRLLCALGEDVTQIEQAHVALVERLIRKKKFRRYLINNCYPVAIDGSRKMNCAGLWSEALLEQRLPLAQGEREPRYQYYVYVLEASLCFANGMVIPLMSEFLDFRQGDGGRDKQDCEMRAFHRLSERLKQAFPRLPILLLLDGLYANGPVMQRACDYHWQFMIVLKDDALACVWGEYRALAPRLPGNEHRQHWGGRAQQFRWVNDITYEFGPNGRQRLSVHVVVCDEQWQRLDEHGDIVTGQARHAWLSSRALRRDNVHQRCNLAARHRWGIEAGFLVEKHHGYHYEHCFAQHWHALRGYHYLMRLAHLMNTLARFAATLAPKFRQIGVRGFIRFVRQSLSGPWFDPVELARRLARPFTLRLT